MRTRRVGLVVAIAAAAMVGCARASTPAPAAPPEPTASPESVSSPTPATPPAQTVEPEPPAVAGAAPARGPAYYLVPPDELAPAVASRRAALRATGQQLREDEVGYYMDVQEARFRQVAADGVLVARAAQRVVLSLPGSLGFDVGSATLTDDATAAVRVLARVLVEYRLSVVAVHGHTDASGDSVANQRLSEQRALAVARQLIASGVSSERIVISGFGAIAPRGSNASIAGREANRRIELHITPLGP